MLMLCVAGCVSTKPVVPQWVEVSTTRQVDNSNLTETVTGTVNGEQITALTTFRRFHPNDRKRHEHWLGTDGGDPDYVVSSMSVTRNGEKIAIPHDLYSDFGDFAFQGGFLRILQSDAGFAVKHCGSDGAGSFDGTFYFDANGLDRVVISTLGFTDDGLVGRVQHTRKPKAEQGSAHQSTTAP